MDELEALRLSTFSIVARDQRRGMFGVAVSTAVPAVGSLCPFARAGVGAVATQSFVNPYLGIDAIGLMEEGLSAQQALDRLLAEDPGREVRQVSAVDRNGLAASFSGSNCTGWFGHLTGPGVAIAGNMLVGESTITAMAKAYEAAIQDDLPERLMRALEAGQEAGGDFRGRQSAALKVVAIEEYPYCDLRVDEHPHPVAELRRVLEVAKVQLFPFIQGLPSRSDRLGSTNPAIADMLMKPPAKRRPARGIASPG